MTQDRSKQPGRQRTLQAATGNDADLGLWRKTVADLNEALNDVQTDIETLRIMVTTLQGLAAAVAEKLQTEDVEGLGTCYLAFESHRVLGRKLIGEVGNLIAEEFSNTFNGLGVTLPVLEDGLRAKDEPADRRRLDERKTVKLLEQALEAAKNEQPDAVPLISRALEAASGEFVSRSVLGVVLSQRSGSAKGGRPRKYTDAELEAIVSGSTGASADELQAAREALRSRRRRRPRSSSEPT